MLLEQEGDCHRLHDKFDDRFAPDLSSVYLSSFPPQDIDRLESLVLLLTKLIR